MTHEENMQFAIRDLAEARCIYNMLRVLAEHAAHAVAHDLIEVLEERGVYKHCLFDLYKKAIACTNSPKPASNQ